MMLRRLALAALLALSPSLALAQVNSPDFSIAAYVRNALAGNVTIGGNLTVGGIIIDTSGGITVGSPTGGSQGTGTINVAVNYFKNGIATPSTVSLPLALAAGNISCPTCVLISGTAHGDSAYAILSTDRYVYTNAAFTAARIWTLPAANSLAAGTTIWVQDAQGTVTSTNTLTVQRAGADTVNVTGTNIVMTGAAGGTQFTTDGVSNWGTAVQTVTTGGTGRQTLTNHGLLVGAGTNPLTQLGVATTGQLLFGVTGADPAFSSTGTGVQTALGVNVGTAGALVVNGGALGTPSSGTLTNATGLPLGTGVTGTLLAAQEPAHTGGCTNSAGSLALSCQINTNFGMGHGGNCGGIAAASTAFFGPNGCFNATEATVQAPISAPITLKNFYVKSGVAPGGSDTYTVTVRKNTADTTITCTISAAATTCSDLTHSVSYVAADLIDVKVVTSATAVTATFMTMSTAVTTTP